MVDELIKLVRDGFADITDKRRNNMRYDLTSYLGNYRVSLFNARSGHIKMQSNTVHTDLTTWSPDAISLAQTIGIHLNTVAGSTDLAYNILNYSGFTAIDPASAGIALENTSGAFLDGNQVSGDSGFMGLQTGIRASSSPNNEYCCNTVDECVDGLAFNGDCSGTDLKGTTFTKHHTGLVLTQALQKEDANWIIGYDTTPDSVFFLMNMRFDEDTFQIEQIDAPFRMDVTKSVISTKEGDLVCYSNGVEINNTFHEQVINEAILALIYLNV